MNNGTLQMTDCDAVEVVPHPEFPGDWTVRLAGRAMGRHPTRECARRAAVRSGYRVVQSPLPAPVAVHYMPDGRGPAAGRPYTCIVRSARTRAVEAVTHLTRDEAEALGEALLRAGEAKEAQ